MPKKTREQKIRSMERRLTRLEQSAAAPVDNSDDLPSAPSAPVFQLPNIRKQVTSQQQKTSATVVLNDAKAVQQDILRIIILTIGILGIEFLLYWLIKIR